MRHKDRVRGIFDALASGDHRPLLEATAEDVRWRWMGVDRWSKTFEGKQAVIEDLFSGVADTLDDSGTTRVHHIYADGDHVVVEHTGSSATPDGRRYDNNYCWVLDFTDGQIHEIREYMDTHLLTETFADDPS